MDAVVGSQLKHLVCMQHNSRWSLLLSSIPLISKLSLLKYNLKNAKSLVVECYSGIYDSEMSISTVPTNHPTKVIANNKANVDEMNRVLIGFKVIPTYRISFKLAVQRIQKLAKHR